MVAGTAPGECDDAPSPVVPSRVAGLALLVPFAVLALSTQLPWLRVRTGESTHHYALDELAALRYLVVALIVIGVCGVVVEALVLRRWPLTIPTLASLSIAAIAGTVLLLAEVASMLLPTALLPGPVRDLTVDVYAGAGIWVALGTSVLAVVGSRARGGLIGAGTRVLAAARRLPAPLVRAIAVACLASVCALWARYQTWFVGSTSGRTFDIAGSELPVAGPASLFAGVGVLVYRRHLVAALAVAFAGWALTFVAASTLVVGSVLERISITSLLPDDYQHLDPTITMGWGMWLTFVLGCITAACAAAVVWCAGAEARR